MKARILLLLMTTLPLTAEVRIEKDLAYLGPDRAEKMDAYLPANTFPRPRPAVILIHGGGWRSGDKADGREREIAEFLATEGFAVFSINYLLNLARTDPATGKSETIKHAWPQNFADCKSALRFVRKDAGRFGIDPQRIAVMGESAGGHLAMLVGTTSGNSELNQLGLYREQPNTVKAIVTFYADFDLRDRPKPPFFGTTREETLAILSAASPVTYFDQNSPPVLICHGTADQIVSVERSRRLARHLDELGIEHTYVEIPDAPHSFTLSAGETDLRPPLLKFLRTQLESPMVNP